MALGIPEIAEALSEAATVMELLGENAFKVRAHANAARVVETWGGSVEQLLSDANAGKVRGIGQALAQRLALLATAQPDPELEALRAKIPAGLFAILRIPGLGPKKVRALWKEAHIETLEALEKACREGAVSTLKGFGKKTQQNILEGIERLRQYANQFLFSDAFSRGAVLLEHLRKSPLCSNAELAGSLRRCKEVIGDLDIVAASRDAPSLIEHFLHFNGIAKTIATGETKASVLLESGIQVDLRVVAASEFAAALMYFTGSKAHNVHLRARAHQKGLKLNEYGLFDDTKPLPLTSEDDIYAALDLSFIAPELREDRGEIEVAEAAHKAGTEMPALLDQRELRGIMHAHTTYSDGRNTLREMALAVQALGYDYFVVTDHSRSAAYAGGLSIEKVQAQHREIERLNEELSPFRVFRGIESDILSSGELDYPVSVLANFEIVIASIHSGFTMSEQEMTKRIIAAARDPHTTCLGHLTGRLLLEREGYQVNVTEILHVCAQEGVAIEINANPHRLDLDWRFHAAAVAQGIALPIGPDAHSIEGLQDVRFGVGVARKGGLTAQDVPNCLSLAKFSAWANRRRGAVVSST